MQRTHAVVDLAFKKPVETRKEGKFKRPEASRPLPYYRFIDDPNKENKEDVKKKTSKKPTAKPARNRPPAVDVDFSPKKQLKQQQPPVDRERISALEEQVRKLRNSNAQLELDLRDERIDRVIHENDWDHERAHLMDARDEGLAQVDEGDEDFYEKLCQLKAEHRERLKYLEEKLFIPASERVVKPEDSENYGRQARPVRSRSHHTGMPARSARAPDHSVTQPSSTKLRALENMETDMLGERSGRRPSWLDRDFDPERDNLDQGMGADDGMAGKMSKEDYLDLVMMRASSAIAPKDKAGAFEMSDLEKRLVDEELQLAGNVKETGLVEDIHRRWHELSRWFDPKKTEGAAGPSTDTLPSGQVLDDYHANSEKALRNRWHNMRRRHLDELTVKESASVEGLAFDVADAISTGVGSLTHHHHHGGEGESALMHGRLLGDFDDASAEALSKRWARVQESAPQVQIRKSSANHADDDYRPKRDTEQQKFAVFNSVETLQDRWAVKTEEQRHRATARAQERQDKRLRQRLLAKNRRIQSARARSALGIRSTCDEELEEGGYASDSQIVHPRHRRPDSWKLKFTIPEPFSFTLRGETLESTKKSIRQMRMELDLKEKKLLEEKELKTRPKVQKIKSDISKPRYQELLQADEERRRSLPSRAAQRLRDLNEPFSFEKKQAKIQAQRAAERRARRASMMDKFTARELPEWYQDRKNDSYKETAEAREAERKSLQNQRAQRLQKEARLPPRMELWETTVGKQKRELMEERRRIGDPECTFRPKITTEKVNYEKEQARCEAAEKRLKEQNARRTVPQPFGLSETRHAEVRRRVLQDMRSDYEVLPEPRWPYCSTRPPPMRKDMPDFEKIQSQFRSETTRATELRNKAIEQRRADRKMEEMAVIQEELSLQQKQLKTSKAMAPHTKPREKYDFKKEATSKRKHKDQEAKENMNELKNRIERKLSSKPCVFDSGKYTQATSIAMQKVEEALRAQGFDDADDMAREWTSEKRGQGQAAPTDGYDDFDSS
eukprot:Rmarinus@m.20977